MRVTTRKSREERLCSASDHPTLPTQRKPSYWRPLMRLHHRHPPPPRHQRTCRQHNQPCPPSPLVQGRLLPHHHKYPCLRPLATGLHQPSPPGRQLPWLWLKPRHLPRRRRWTSPCRENALEGTAGPSSGRTRSLSAELRRLRRPLRPSHRPATRRRPHIPTHHLPRHWQLSQPSRQRRRFSPRRA